MEMIKNLPEFKEIVDLTEVCRFCRCSSVNTSNTINDIEVIEFLSSVTSIDLADELLLSDKLCQLCWEQVNISIRFINKVINTQAIFDKHLKTLKSSSKLKTSEEVLCKIKQYSGISIKRVSEKYPILQENVIYEDDILDVNADSDSDINNAIEIHAAKSRASPKNKAIIIDAVSYNCAKCQGKFADFSSLSSHIKSSPCETETYDCRICKKHFKSKRCMNAHMAIHKPKQKTVSHTSKTFNCTYRCAFCTLIFSSHFDLLSHVKSHNEKNDGPRLCEVCARECPNKKSYNAHMAIHRGKKSFVCDTCGKSFMKSFLLVQHMHTHSGIKSFSCNVCHKRYAKRDSLRIHTKKEHPIVDDR